MEQPSTERARHIVVLASEMAENNQAKSWLASDERGTWEAMAKRLLEVSADRAVALAMSVHDVNEAVAIELILAALNAIKARAEAG